MDSRDREIATLKAQIDHLKGTTHLSSSRRYSPQLREGAIGNPMKFRAHPQIKYNMESTHYWPHLPSKQNLPSYINRAPPAYAAGANLPRARTLKNGQPNHFSVKFTQYSMPGGIGSSTRGAQ